MKQLQHILADQFHKIQLIKKKKKPKNATSTSRLKGCRTTWYPSIGGMTHTKLDNAQILRFIALNMLGFYYVMQYKEGQSG